MITKTELVLQLYNIGCIQFGDFVLASNQQSPIYIDLRRINSNPVLLRAVVQTYTELIKPLSFDYLAAVPYAALTIGAAIGLAIDKPLIYPRKETKIHGINQVVEGVFSVGKKAIIIEDLVTSGESVLKAIELLVLSGLKVQDVAVLIDREQDAGQNLARQGYQLHTTLLLSEILEILLHEKQISIKEFEMSKHR